MVFSFPGVIIGVGGGETVVRVGEGEGGVEVCPFVLGELQRATTISLRTQEESATGEGLRGGDEG